MVGTIRYRHENIFLMFVLISALDRRWYGGLINKINYDLIIGYIYKSDVFFSSALPYSFIYIAKYRPMNYIYGEEAERLGW